MDLIANLSLGFGVAFTPINLLYAFIGCVLGTLIGVLPGIGPVATIAMLSAGHLCVAAGFCPHHARRHLLRRSVRWLDDGRAGQSAGGVVLCGHLY